MKNLSLKNKRPFISWFRNCKYLKMKNAILLAIILGLLISCKRPNATTDSGSENGKSEKAILPPSSVVKNSADQLMVDSLPKNVLINFQNDSILLADVKQIQKLRILNNTSEPIVFGDDFILEYYANGAWHKTNNGRQFKVAQYTLTPGREYVMPTDLYFYSTIYKLGKYRISKPYRTANSSLSTQNKTTLATYEFKVLTPPFKNMERKVFMSLSKNTVKISELNQPIPFTIINNSYDEIFFGERQTVEKYDGKNWNKIPFDGIINDIGYSLYVGTQTSEHSLKLHPEQYKYKPGRYRLVKPFSIRNDDGIKSMWKDFTLYNEFLVVP